MPSPWLIIAFLLLWIGSLPAAFYYGRHYEGVERNSQMLQAVEQSVARSNELAATDYAEAALAFDAALNRQRVAAASARQVEHSVVTKIEYRNCALDAADFALLNNALEAKK